jgi:hypothetical protein
MPITIRNLDATAAPQKTGCCGGDAPAGTDACCALDADVKSAGGNGCGCGDTVDTPVASAAPVAPAPAAKGCC